MSAAGRALIVETVGAIAVPTGDPPPGDCGAFVHVGLGPRAPLAQHAGRSRVFEVVADPLPGDRPHSVGMTPCASPFWDEDWLIRVRYEAAGPVELHDTVAADVRAIITGVRATNLTSEFELVMAGHRRHEIEEIPGPDGEPLALIAEIPLRVRFHE
ncbi:MAG: hypothetical protein EKK55_16360 [Rhodocyclaceae bacterium]|nr:MAG: hypothetical protein EKK55_16360 [Rhodocyclaceae bacterium]